MKSRGFLLLTLFSLLFILPLTSAVEVTMNSAFAQGETFLAKYSGNFVDQITNDNVHFYRNGATSYEVPMTPSGVVKINNDFYVYALLVNTSGNYSIKIQGVRYYKATQIVSDNIVSNFTISNETAAFSITPGAISTGADFSVNLQNQLDKKITININKDSSLMSSPSSIDLNTGVSSTIQFTILASAVSGLTTITFSSGNASYSMPVYLETSNPAQTNNTTNATGQNLSMEFQPKIVNVSMATGSDTKRILYLKNTGTGTLKNIFFNVSSSLKPYVTVSQDKISSLNPDELASVEINISSGAVEKTVRGAITAYTENISSSFDLSLDFVKDFVPAAAQPGENPTVAALCEDLGGNICQNNQECSGDIVQSKNGDCCVPPLVCQEPKKSSSKTIIGWGLLILVLIIIIWFFKRRYSKVRKIKPF